jgi:hypothetical protein
MFWMVITGPMSGNMIDSGTAVTGRRMVSHNIRIAAAVGGGGGGGGGTRAYAGAIIVPTRIHWVQLVAVSNSTAGTQK